MNSKHGLTQAELDQPLYPETEELLIPHGPANEKYQDLIARHKNLGACASFEKRRLALALAQAIRLAGRGATDWEMAIMEDAGLRKMELPKSATEIIHEIHN